MEDDQLTTKLLFINDYKKCCLVSRGDRGFYGTDLENAREFWEKRNNEELPENLFKPLLGNRVVMGQEDGVPRRYLLGFFHLKEATCVWLGDEMAIIRVGSKGLNWISFASTDKFDWCSVTDFGSEDGKYNFYVTSVCRASNSSFPSNKDHFHDLVDEANKSHRHMFYDKCKVVRAEKRDNEYGAVFTANRDKDSKEFYLFDYQSHLQVGHSIAWVKKIFVRRALEGPTTLPVIEHIDFYGTTIILIEDKDYRFRNTTLFVPHTLFITKTADHRKFHVFIRDEPYPILMEEFRKEKHAKLFFNHVSALINRIETERANTYYDQVRVIEKNSQTKMAVVCRLRDDKLFEIRGPLLDKVTTETFLIYKRALLKVSK